MAKIIQLRRGTSTEHTNFIGAPGEVTVDTTKKVLVVHDGVTPGGFPTSRLDNVTGNATFTGQMRITNTTPSSSTATGALIITGGLGVGGRVTASQIVETSSIAFKTNVSPIENGLDSILKLSGVTYDRKDQTSKNEAGLIAEEVAKVLPNLVTLDDKGKPNGVLYTKIIAYLVEAIKDQQKQIDKLKKKD